MRFHRINRPLAVALAAGAVMAPSAAAQGQDLRSPDTRDAAERTLPVEPRQDLRSPDTRDAAEPPRFYQDLRSPDTRDAVEGRGLETAPVVEFVEVPQPQASGFDWTDAGLGAAAGIGLVLIGAGGAIATVRMRRRVIAGS